MEEELAEQAARKNRVESLMTEIGELSEHYQNKLDLQERITTWCTELMEDLLLIDSEVLELSRHRRPVNEIRTKVEGCWRKIELAYGNITRDAEWLHSNVDSIQPDLVELWWLMSEDVQKRLLTIRDHFMAFFEVHVEFKEFVQVFSERFKEDPHFIFERYRHFQ